MPELPEVETIVNDLKPYLVGRRLVRVQVFDPILVRHPGQQDFCRRLVGRIIKGLRRRGKYIVLDIQGGLSWIVHLRMTGRMLMELPCNEKYQRAMFKLDDGNTLWYCDLRRFGDMWASWPGEEEYLGGFGSLGPEPISGDFDGDYLFSRISKRKAPIKSLLLDQRIVAGLGNIYVDEALFVAGIMPNREGASLNLDQCHKIAVAVKGIISKAIVGRGTTFSDYRSGLGTQGEFQTFLKVYGRAGQECVNCSTGLEKLKIGGRTTVFCPQCQD